MHMNALKRFFSEKPMSKSTDLYAPFIIVYGHIDAVFYLNVQKAQ